MKKTAFMGIVFTVTLMFLISSFFTIKTAEAANSTNYKIEYVGHTVEVMHNGHVFINDTIWIVGNGSTGETIDRFQMGFPHKYGQYVLQCMAFSGSNFFNVTLNVPLENRMGFYAVEITFPQPLDVSSGMGHIFSVTFILSNDLLDVPDTNRYVLDFPAYPSLTKSATSCNTTILFPDNMTDITIEKNDGTITTAVYRSAPLPAFTSIPATATFTLASDKLRVFDVEELKREITISGLGEITGSDSYYITNNEPTAITFIEILLLANVSDVSAQDQFGRKFAQNPTLVEAGEAHRYRIAFPLPLESYKSSRFTVKYSLPTRYIMPQEGTSKFNVTLPLFPHMDYYIEKASVTIILPEGARLISEDNLVGNTYSVTRGIFQETVTMMRQGVGFLEDLVSENVLQVVYDYSLLWLAFRPTLWVWALAVVGCAIIAVWRRPKGPVAGGVPTVAVKLSSDFIKSFVDSYEEKQKIILEIGSLENMVQKGKIPRRRYKVRRKTLETRLSSLSKSLSESGEKLRVAGGKYADLMRQLEIAETEINEVDANIRSIEARHSRGEISLEAYRKLLGDYQHRKDVASTTISGTLLRLREELR